MNKTNKEKFNMKINTPKNKINIKLKNTINITTIKISTYPQYVVKLLI